MVRAAGLIAAISVLAVQGCGGQPPGKPKASAWTTAPNAQGTQPAADQPASFDGWQARTSFRSQTRAFADSWSPALSADGDLFPAGGNSCESSRSLVKWRSLATGTTVRATWHQAGIPNDTDPKPGGEVATAERGWMVLDGCSEPLFSFGKDDDPAVNLVDVVYTVRQYDPKP